WELKIRWHDADDGRGFAVNSDALSDDVWIGIEIAAPYFVTKDRDLFGTGLVVCGSEIPTDHRRDPDDLEKIFGYVTAGITLRIIVVSDIVGRSAALPGYHRN